MNWPDLSGGDENVDAALEHRFGALVAREFSRGMDVIEDFLDEQLKSGVSPDDATLFDYEDTRVDYIRRAHRAMLNARALLPDIDVDEYGDVHLHPHRRVPVPIFDDDPARHARPCACGHFTNFLGEHSSALTYRPRILHTMSVCASEEADEPDTSVPHCDECGDEAVWTYMGRYLCAAHAPEDPVVSWER